MWFLCTDVDCRRLTHSAKLQNTNTRADNACIKYLQMLFAHFMISEREIKFQ